MKEMYDSYEAAFDALKKHEMEHTVKYIQRVSRGHDKSLIGKILIRSR